MITTDTATASTSDAPRSSLPSGSRLKKPRKTGIAIGFGLVLICVVGVFSSSSVAAAGLWSMALMLVLIILSVPVAIALTVPSLLGIYAISGVPAMANVMATVPFNTVSTWSMSVLPMFIFMGMLLSESGMTTRIYRATDRWFSWLPGGIGIGTTAAGAGLASVSGSTVGMTYTLARAGIPEMLRAGYDKRIAVGTVIVAGLPGQLIPPSILLVVYAGIAAVPVGPQLVAGALPGLLIAVFFALFILVIGVFAPKLVGRSKGGGRGRSQTTWRERLQSLREIWGLPVIMFVLFGGMFSGIFTPTEAGSAAALTALVLTIIQMRRDAPLHKVARAALATVSATAAIFFIMIGAEMLTRLLSITGLAPMVTDMITGLGLNRIAFLLLLIVFYLILGMFFDTLSMMLLTVPILLPTLEVMGVSPLWFGVYVVLLGELAMITPPVGVLSFIVHNITKAPQVNLGHRISLTDVFISLLWFLPIVILFLCMMIAVPQMTEWLPALLENASGSATAP